MDIKLSFLGAAQNVTGSRFYLEVDGLRLLIDCGLYQERQFAGRNWEPFPVDPRKINAVLLTHAHLDHCGLLPKLVKDGFRGEIYCTAPTAEIAQIIMMDAAHIQEEDAAFKLKRHAREGRTSPRPVEPLYTVEDAQRVEPLFHHIRYDKPRKIGRGTHATFLDAGHVFGSSFICLEIERHGETRKILFSGDIGRRNMPIIHDPAIVEGADYILVESTYGDRVHHPPEDINARLAKVINETVQAGGKLVVPSFALERSQDLLYHLNELLMAGKIPELKIFLDSPMAIKITNVFSEHPELFDREMTRLVSGRHSPFDLPGLTMTSSTKESKAINDITGPAIIIAGSGMCTGGRIKHHLVNTISDPKNTILFVGYQAAGTLGRQVLDGAPEVRIHGEMRQVKARIERVNGFSAHADRDELTSWLMSMKKTPRCVFVVHGEAESAKAFGEHLRGKTGWNVMVPAYKEEVILE